MSTGERIAFRLVREYLLPHARVAWVERADGRFLVVEGPLPDRRIRVFRISPGEVHDVASILNELQATYLRSPC